MPSPHSEVFQSVRTELVRLRSELLEAELRSSRELSMVCAAYRASAANLLHYLVARQVDLRPLQLELWQRGLSSLGRIEGHVRGALDQVIARLDDALARTGDLSGTDEPKEPAPLTSDDADQLLHLHTRDLFGKKPSVRHIYVMVTVFDAFEVDDAWISRLFDAGMNVLRVNGAHEDAPEWNQIVQTARRVAVARGASLRVLVDLPGPKLRTVAPGPGLQVERWKPERDAFGRVTVPCRISLRPALAANARPDGPGLEVPATIWSKLAVGDALVLRDARGRKRRLEVVERGDDQAFATLDRTAYVVPETTVKVRRQKRQLGEFRLGVVDGLPFRLTLAEGDRFRLLAAPIGEAALADSLAVMGCSLGEAVLGLRPGARVLFDDGKLECVVETHAEGGVVLRVTHAPRGRFRLGGEKGINLPDTPISGPTLGPDDERALAFAVSAADIVGASFVRGPDDVRTLCARLDQLGARSLGVVLKIETVSAFAQLPAILLAAMTRYPIGVMIARGDLAVEAGFERLAELQEEILWLCEAAHLPVIWATQVLDQLARTGTATRAEVTDAAMSVRAECVMLNKGPCVTEAVKTLVDILRRMEHHHYKKRSLYRRLHVEIPNSLGGSASPPFETA